MAVRMLIGDSLVTGSAKNVQRDRRCALLITRRHEIKPQLTTPCGAAALCNFGNLRRDDVAVEPARLDGAFSDLLKDWSGS